MLSQDRAEVETPSHHLTYRLHQFATTHLFEHVASSAIAHGRTHMRHVDRRGQHDDACAGQTLAHLSGYLETTETGDHDVDNEHVRVQTCDQGDSVQPTGSLSDHV